MPGLETRTGVPRLPRAVMLVAVLCTYGSYLLLLAGGGGLVSRRVGQVTTLAILLGVAVIPALWVLTGLYVWWANRRPGPARGRGSGPGLS